MDGVDELQALLDCLPIAIGISTDSRCENIRMNRSFANLLGLLSDPNSAKPDASDRTPSDIKMYRNGRELAPDELPMQLAARKGVEIRDFEEEIIWTDGTTFHLLGYAAPLRDKHGAVSGSVGAFVDITERKQAEEKLKTSLQEKETLLKELHHRVKNDMQVISSLLQLQANCIKDEKVREMFRECRERIHSMALVHEKLYQSKDLSRIDFTEYLNSLLPMLFRSYGTPSSSIKLESDLEQVSLSMNLATPLGLVLNELISNSLKHAFPDGRSGVVRVSLHTNPQSQLALTVSDDGIGLGKDFNLENTSTLGWKIVNILASQIGGTLNFQGNHGTPSS